MQVNRLTHWTDECGIWVLIHCMRQWLIDVTNEMLGIKRSHALLRNIEHVHFGLNFIEECWWDETDVRMDDARERTTRCMLLQRHNGLLCARCSVLKTRDALPKIPHGIYLFLPLAGNH